MCVTILQGRILSRLLGRYGPLNYTATYVVLTSALHIKKIWPRVLATSRVLWWVEKLVSLGSMHDVLIQTPVTVQWIKINEQLPTGTRKYPASWMFLPADKTIAPKTKTKTNKKGNAKHGHKTTCTLGDSNPGFVSNPSLEQSRCKTCVTLHQGRISIGRYGPLNYTAACKVPCVCTPSAISCSR
jgi:hypothetical protein